MIDAGGEAAPDLTQATPSWHRRTAFAVTAVALLPVLIIIVTRTGSSYFPAHDIAIIDLRVRDVFSGDSPLTGPFSRYGWNHPGPLMFYVLAPLNALAGGDPWSTLVGAAILKGAAIVLAAMLAWRRGGLVLVLLVLSAISLSGVAIGPEFLLDAWNPHVAFAFFPLFILQVWSITLGDRWQIAGAAVVGTFLVQTHAAYIPLVAAGGLWALVVVVVLHRRRHQSLQPWRAPLVVALAVAAVLCLPPLIEQLTTDPGNVTKIARYVRDGGGAVTGLETGAGLFAAEFRMLPPWLGGSDLVRAADGASGTASLAWLALPALLLAVGALAARRARDATAGRLLGLVAVLSVTSLAALARIERPPYPYLFYWRIAVATFIVVAAAWAVLRALHLESEGRPAVATFVALTAVLVAAAGSLSADVAGHDDALTPCEPAISSLVDGAKEAGIPHAAFLVRNVDSLFDGVYPGFIDALDRVDAPVRVSPNDAPLYGESRTARARDVATIWYVVRQGPRAADLEARSGARVVARVEPDRTGGRSTLCRFRVVALPAPGTSGQGTTDLSKMG